MSDSIINVILSELNMKPGSFAKAIGAHPTQIYDLQSGKTKNISSVMADKIIDAFPRFNKSFLIAGEGEMLKREVQEPVAIKPDFKEESYHLVPFVNIDSVGGLHSQNMITPSEEHIIKLIPFTEAREGDVAIIQSGNSMTPTIPPGSVLLLREVPEWREYFGYGNIFVLWLKDGRRVTKEIRRYDGDAKNYVWCVSHNPDVADEELPKSFIKGVWKVIKFQADFGW